MSKNNVEDEFKIFALLLGTVSIFVAFLGYAAYRICHPSKNYLPTRSAFGLLGFLHNPRDAHFEDEVVPLMAPPPAYADTKGQTGDDSYITIPEQTMPSTPSTAPKTQSKQSLQ